MTARFPGKCKACGEKINRGDSINFFGRGHVEHADCAEEESDTRTWVEGDEHEGDESFPPSRAELASDRRLARQGLTVIRTSGGTFTQNSKGRCEDAPCCGCCT